MFLKDHPGGSSIIVLYSGKKNATDEFIRVGHNMKARKTLETFCVGKLAKVQDIALAFLSLYIYFIANMRIEQTELQKGKVFVDIIGSNDISSVWQFSYTSRQSWNDHENNRREEY